MKAAIFEEFRQPLEIRDVPSPQLSADGVIIDVEACGICRSDWHGWMGHDSDVHLPHVPGHELAGRISSVGGTVTQWKVGQRVTVPFCCGCGTCAECVTGNQQICDQYTQPGFTQWGAFAEQVQIRCADVNLVALPDDMDFVTAASLGCRFATSFRAIVDQGRVGPGDWVAIHGCGGVGLSAVMIAKALGANVIAVDIRDERLRMAEACGAAILLNASTHSVVDEIKRLTGGGATVSLDALGSRHTCWNSIACLRKRGRHVQVGLTVGGQADPAIPMGAVVGRELELYGSHGLQAHAYPRMFRLIRSGAVNPALLISDCVTLEQAAGLLPRLDEFPGDGVTIIDRF